MTRADTSVRACDNGKPQSRPEQVFSTAPMKGGIAPRFARWPHSVKAQKKHRSIGHPGALSVILDGYFADTFMPENRLDTSTPQ